MEFVLTNLKWGTSPLGTGGGMVTWSFADVSRVGIFQFDSTISNPTYQGLVRTALQAWENVANIDFVEVVDSATTQLRFGFDAIDGPQGTAGESSSRGSSDQFFDPNNERFSITTSEIRFDPADSGTPADPGSFFGIALHEIGHSIGLGHTNDTSTIMFPTITSLMTLGAGDINGAQAIYGAAVNPNPDPVPEALRNLFSANADVANGLAAAYQTLLGGVPSQAGFTSLINTAVATNFGAGGTTVFNAENIFINLFNNLVQGNQAAATQFAMLAGAGPLSDQITALYNVIVPESARSAEGLAFFNRADATSFYTASALERGITSDNGPAVIAAAAILRVAVRDRIPGLGDNVNDLFMAVTGNSAALPAGGSAFTDIDVADGTAFDGGDIGMMATAALTTTSTSEIETRDLSESTEGEALIQIALSRTTAPTPEQSLPVIQEISTQTEPLIFHASTHDVVEFNIDLSGSALGDGSDASLDGANLLAALKQLNVESDGDNGYALAYGDNNAYLYRVNDAIDGDTRVDASDIQLVGTFAGLAVGELDGSNFEFA